MKFGFCAAFLALSTAVLASPIPAPQATASASCVDATVSALNAIESQLAVVNGTVSGFTHYLGDILDLLTIEADTVQLMCDIDSATSQVQSCGNFTQAETFTILVDAFDLLTPIQDTLTVIGDKKPQFDASILNSLSSSFLVKYDLQQLQTKTDALGAALAAAVPANLKSTVTITFSRIDGWYDSALAIYASA